MFEFSNRLGGRLDLLVSQIKTNTEEDTLASENLLVYEDRGKQYLNKHFHFIVNNAILYRFLFLNCIFRRFIR